MDTKVRQYLERGLTTIQTDSPRLESARVFEAGSPEGAAKELTLAEISPDPYIVSQVARAKLERANRSHEATLQVLVSFLQSNGFLVQTNRLADAYCRLKTGPAFFEVKSVNPSNERTQCRHALSQLYEYRYLHSIPESSLWLVLSEPLKHGWIVEYLAGDRGVDVLWVESEILSGPGMGELLSSWASATNHSPNHRG